MFNTIKTFAKKNKTTLTVTGAVIAVAAVGAAVFYQTKYSTKVLEVVGDVVEAATDTVDATAQKAA